MARPPRVGSRIQRTAPPSSSSARELEHRRRVALQVDLELELAAGDHDGHAVVADRAGDEHAVAGPDALRPELDPGGTTPIPAVVT